MSPASSRRSALPADWAAILDQIQHGLEQAVAAATERELAIGPELESETLAALRPPPLDGLDALVRQAEQKVAEAAALLDAGAEAARRWREAAADLRRRLAERQGPSVS